MAGTTISSAQTVGVRLTASSQNPVTVTASGSVITTGADAIYGSATYAWTIGNAGTLKVQSYIIGDGIDLMGSGSVGNTGSIRGIDGVYLGGGGLVSNATGASIIGVFEGVDITNGAGTVVNQGHIEAGIHLGSGGTVSNAATGTITGSPEGVDIGGTGTVVNGGTIIGVFEGVVIANGAGAVVNQGDIVAFVHQGVRLASGGTVSNAATGAIGGSDGIDITNGAGTVVNQGDIWGSAVLHANVVYGGKGVVLSSGGMVSNAATGTITGSGGESGGVGIRISNGAGTVMNQGSIAGGVGVAIYGGAGTVTNAGTITGNGVSVIHGRIAGDVGVAIYGGIGTATNAGAITGIRVGVHLVAGGTLTNAGTISGGGAAAYLGGTGSNLLVVDPGAVFSGVVQGGTSASNTMELASASTTGTLSGLGSSFTDFGSVSIDAGATWDLTGTNTLGPSAMLLNAGTLTLSDATLVDAGTLVNNGAVVLDPSSLTVASLLGVGVITIDADGTLDVRGAIASGETIDLAGDDRLLRLGAPASAAGLIDGFWLTDTIDLTALPVGDISSVRIAPGNTLTLVETNGTTLGLRLDPTQSFVGLVAGYATDGDRGTNITLGNAPCFRAGTRISTERGEVAVEALRHGDRVRVVPYGTAEPVTWIGHRTVDCRRHPRPQQVWPVRIAAGAFGPGRPGHTLWLSPDHAVSVEDVLIPVKYLINGRSIA